MCRDVDVTQGCSPLESRTRGACPAPVSTSALLISCSPARRRGPPWPAARRASRSALTHSRATKWPSPPLISTTGTLVQRLFMQPFKRAESLHRSRGVRLQQAHRSGVLWRIPPYEGRPIAECDGIGRGHRLSKHRVPLLSLQSSGLPRKLAACFSYVCVLWRS